jgi:hypothetical protein
MKKTQTVFGAVMLSASAAFFIPWQGPPPPAGYTNASVELGAIDPAAADRVCSTTKGHPRLVCLADTLKKDLSPALVAKLQLPYAVADAKKWSNFPPGVYRTRVGPTLGEFAPAQRVVIKVLLKEVAGMAADEGYDEIEQILNADDYLKEHAQSTAGFASGNFHLAFIGTPSATGTWQLYFGGHHLATASTFRDGAFVGGTPSFRGVEPFTRFTQNGRDNAPMAQEQQAFAAMLAALSADERARATLSQTFTDIIVGPQRDDNFPTTRVGVRAGDLSTEKQELVIRAIQTYVRDLAQPNADVVEARYRAELADTWVAFSGTPAVDAQNDYVRIDGPSVWIELSIQPGRSLPGVHPHSVWRDRARDYGGNR